MDSGQHRVGVTPYETEDAMVLGLRGEIDYGNAAGTAAELRLTAADVPPPRIVVLDLTDIAFLSAAGVHILYGFAAECAERGVRTRLVAEPDGIIERVTELAELHRYIPVYNVLSDALAGGELPTG